MSVFGTLLDKSYHVFEAVDNIFLEALNIDSLFDVLSDLQIYWIWLKKVHNLFVINF